MCVCVCGWILWSQFAGSLDSPPCDAVDGGGGVRKRFVTAGVQVFKQTYIVTCYVFVIYLKLSSEMLQSIVNMISENIHQR